MFLDRLRYWRVPLRSVFTRLALACLLAVVSGCHGAAGGGSGRFGGGSAVPASVVGTWSSADGGSVLVIDAAGRWSLKTCGLQSMDGQLQFAAQGRVTFRIDAESPHSCVDLDRGRRNVAAEFIRLARLTTLKTVRGTQLRFVDSANSVIGIWTAGP